MEHLDLLLNENFQKLPWVNLALKSLLNNYIYFFNLIVFLFSVLSLVLVVEGVLISQLGGNSILKQNMVL
jgi:hypothetical protein